MLFESNVSVMIWFCCLKLCKFSNHIILVPLIMYIWVSIEKGFCVSKTDLLQGCDNANFEVQVDAEFKLKDIKETFRSWDAKTLFCKREAKDLEKKLQDHVGQ